MQNIEFWREVFDTYQSLGEGVKVLMIVVPPAFFLSCLTLFFWYRISIKKLDAKQQERWQISTPEITEEDKEERADNSQVLPFRGELLFRVYKEKGETITVYQDQHPAKPSK